MAAKFRPNCLPDFPNWRETFSRGRLRVYRCDNLFDNFWRVALLALLVGFCSCEGDPFDRDSKEIAQGYRLKRIGNSSRFAFLAPYDTGGLMIDEIGWRKPFILARASGSQYWDRINTDRAEHIRISDAQRMSDSDLRSIPIETAEIAWNHLKRHKRIW
jgi:hypothetical protein